MTFILPEYPELRADDRRRLTNDFERFGGDGLSTGWEQYLRQAYGVDLASSYAGLPIRNPFGKASGQLSMTERQVRDDCDAGLGFVVLKTVIAQDQTGARAMAEWAIPETRMQVEPIAGTRVGALGWTTTWKGRGWSGTLDEYCAFVTSTLRIAREQGTVVAVSAKYHLPGPGETTWKEAEYTYTTGRLLEAWRAAGRSDPLLIEKDFSPTLAGDQRASQQERILEWVRTCPGLIRAAAPDAVRVVLKLMNTTYDDDFQFDVLQAAVGSGAIDGLTYANRLFDPRREFLGKVGIAYGGPDLSWRNLRLLTRLRVAETKGELAAPIPPLSATGDVTNGRVAVEYALRGCTSLQMHTIFQLPAPFYAMQKGSRSARALHLLLFHPYTGLVGWILHARDHLRIEPRFSVLAGWYRTPRGQQALVALEGGGTDR